MTFNGFVSPDNQTHFPISKTQLELSETPVNIAEAIFNLRQKINENKNLQAFTDAGFLLRFLRARKFDEEKALQLYVNYISLHVYYPDVFGKLLRPSRMMHMFEEGVVSLLPEPDANGCRIVLFRPGIWEPKVWDQSDMFRANVIVVEDLLLNHQEVQLYGIVVLVSLTNFGWQKHMIQLANMDFAKRAASLIQDTMPIRVKAVHIIYEPTGFARVFGFIQPLLKIKHRKRITFHGNSLESLHQHIPSNLLPSGIELGGTGSTIPSNDYVNHIRSLEDHFDFLNRTFYS